MVTSAAVEPTTEGEERRGVGHPLIQVDRSRLKKKVS